MRNGPTILDGDAALLSNHYFVRDGSVWLCRECGTTRPFPSPMPADAGACTPRTWGSSAPTAGGGNVPGMVLAPARPVGRLPRVYDRADGGPCAVDNRCPKCGAEPGERCIDGRRISGTTLRPHRERTVVP